MADLSSTAINPSKHSFIENNLEHSFNQEKELSESWVRDYKRQGFLGPISLIDENLARKVGQFVCSEVARSKRFSFVKQKLRHTLSYRIFANSSGFTFATRNRHLDNDMISIISLTPLMGHISSVLLSANPVLWRSQMILNTGKTGTGHGLHRDNYIGLVENINDQVSCQIALSTSTHENCMIFLPGSHHIDDDDVSARFGLSAIPLKAEDVYGTNRYRQLDQLPEKSISRIIMRPGECIFFHPKLIHGSSSMAKIQSFDKLDPPSSRQAIVMRIVSESNKVLPKAFAQTLPRKDQPISI